MTSAVHLGSQFGGPLSGQLGGKIADRLSVDLGGLQNLRASARSGDPAALKAAAKQFEAMFVQMMLKTMRETRFSAEGDVYADSSSLKLYQELLDQQWAQKMVDGKGFGFAEMITRRVAVEQGVQPAPGDDASSTLATMPAVAVWEGAAPKAVPESTQVVANAPVAPSAPSTAAMAAAGAAVSPPVDARPTQAVSPAQERKQRFIETMLPHAQAAERATGIPARFILAHAALESGWGEREIKTGDGAASHNLFGIKPGQGWTGATTETQTTEYRHGLAMKVTDRFRAYAGYDEAFTDYANLLSRRYGQAAAAGDDAEAFVGGLVNGGYATDPAYAGKLHAVIRSVSAVVA